MNTSELYSKILGCSVSGFFKWKKQKRGIVDLLEKCFSKEHLEFYLKNNAAPPHVSLALELETRAYNEFKNILQNQKDHKVLLSMIFTLKTAQITTEIGIDTYSAKLISSEEFLEFAQIKKETYSEWLKAYLEYNLKQNWMPFLTAIKVYDTSNQKEVGSWFATAKTDGERAAISLFLDENNTPKSKQDLG